MKSSKGRKDSRNFSFRRNNCCFYSGTKALGEEVLYSLVERSEYLASDMEAARAYGS
jgi:hypothetical protein